MRKASLSVEQRAEIEVAWTETDETAAAIAERLCVTKNVVMGTVTRAGWKRPSQYRPDRPKPTTLMQRMDALEAGMKAILAEIARDYPNQRPAAVSVARD